MIKKINELVFEKIVSSVKLLKDDFLRFLLLAIIALICGSIGIAYAFGCLYGLFALALIVLFALGALLINDRPAGTTKNENQSG